MRRFHIAILLVVLVWSVQSVFATRKSGEIKIDLTEKQKVFVVDIGNDLMLRVVKDSSVAHSDFGWILEVVKKPYRQTSRNLIYTNKTGTTADRSQVYAWHVAGKEFPNHRVLAIKGYSKKIKVDLIDPGVRGVGEDARFVSGKLKISWSR